MVLGLAACLKRFGKDARGTPAIEFAFAAPVMFVMLIAIIEIGMVLFVTTLMEGALRDASRYGITGAPGDGGVSRTEQIIAIVADRTIGLVNLDEADIQLLVYPNFGSVGQGEDFVDGNSNGQYDAGETYTDGNGNGQWDADIGAAGPGGAGDVVVYRIEYNWPLLTPLGASLAGDENGTIPLRANVAVRNEPFDTGGGGGV